MTYSRWATEKELKEQLVALNYNSEVERSGIPMMYDDNNLYINDGEAHNLIIGATGSGKTQSTLLPQARLAIKAGESIVMHDVKGEIYNILSGELKKRNYNTVVIDLKDAKYGNNFNPLSLAYDLYKKGDKDSAIDVLEKVGHYILADEVRNENQDPFWENAAANYFVGLALYLFENSDEEVNLSSIYRVALEPSKIEEYVKTLDKLSPIYINLSGTVLAPPETKGSIISVLNQKINLFVSREALSKMMSTSNFDIKNIRNVKTAVFIITDNKPFTRRIVPLIIDEMYYAASLQDKKTPRLNIFVDEFETLFPIIDFNSILAMSRGMNIKFTVYLKSFLELRNTYGKESAEIIRMSFGNIIYLLANDSETLEEICRLCGNKIDKEPLITIEELKLFKTFEAIILMPRMYPVRTKLLPDYKMDWKFSEEKVDIPVIGN